MKPLDLLATLAIVAIWGSNIAISKLGVTNMPPLFFTACRFTIVAALLLPFFRLPKGKIKSILLFSILLGSCHFGLMLVGLRGMDSATAIILLQTTVPFSALVAALWYKERLGWLRSAGMGLAFGGVALLAGEPSFPHPLSFLCIIFSALAWVFSNIVAKQLGRIDPLALCCWMAVFGLPQLYLLSFIFETGQIDALLAFRWGFILPCLYTALGASIIAYSLWYRLLVRYPLNQVVPYTLLNPVFGITVGVFLLGETLNWHKLAGAAVTIGGVALIQVGPMLLNRLKKVQPS